MSEYDAFLTKSRTDWDNSNLSGLQWALDRAYASTAAIYAKHPELKTPHAAGVVGTLRWAIVDYFLQESCAKRKINGVEPKWKKLCGKSETVQALELHGLHTVVTAHHLAREDDAPRESDLRKELRASNQTFFPFEAETREARPANNPYGLILAHGGKKAEFAFLRAYHDPENHKAYQSVYADNIMLLPRVVERIDAEEIAEALPALQSHLKQIDMPSSS
jgi:hypothetical protein